MLDEIVDRLFVERDDVKKRWDRRVDLARVGFLHDPGDHVVKSPAALRAKGESDDLVEEPVGMLLETELGAVHAADLELGPRPAGTRVVSANPGTLKRQEPIEVAELKGPRAVGQTSEQGGGSTSIAPVGLEPGQIGECRLVGSVSQDRRAE